MALTARIDNETLFPEQLDRRLRLIKDAHDQTVLDRPQAVNNRPAIEVGIAISANMLGGLRWLNQIVLIAGAPGGKATKNQSGHEVVHDAIGQTHSMPVVP